MFLCLQAWLDAVPNGVKTSRREQYKDSELIDYQPDEDAVWLVSYAMECGMRSGAGFGPAPLTWQEIRAWQLATNNIDPWLAKTIKLLSIKYIIELNAAKEPSRVSPIELEIAEQREAVKKQTLSFLRTN